MMEKIVGFLVGASLDRYRIAQPTSTPVSEACEVKPCHALSVLTIVTVSHDAAIPSCPNPSLSCTALHRVQWALSSANEIKVLASSRIHYRHALTKTS